MGTGGCHRRGLGISQAVSAEITFAPHFRLHPPPNYFGSGRVTLPASYLAEVYQPGTLS